MHSYSASTTLQKTDFYSCQENIQREAKFEVIIACPYFISRTKEITDWVIDQSNGIWYLFNH